MSATDDFAAFSSRKDAERAERDANYISWRKATFPFAQPGDPSGFVAYRQSTGARAYALPLRSGGYEVGTLQDRSRVVLGVERSLADAKERAFALVRDAV